mmetsp:Transcript_3255/g.12428  ORF Transcript_3255/g.12428 Transcript_3255/m.12428 type:complete len:258 (+) Transcript_3255:868-1641(+)
MLSKIHGASKFFLTTLSHTPLSSMFHILVVTLAFIFLVSISKAQDSPGEFCRLSTGQLTRIPESELKVSTQALGNDANVCGRGSTPRHFEQNTPLCSMDVGPRHEISAPYMSAGPCEWRGVQEGTHTVQCWIEHPNSFTQHHAATDQQHTESLHITKNAANQRMERTKTPWLPSNAQKGPCELNKVEARVDGSYDEIYRLQVTLFNETLCDASRLHIEKAHELCQWILAEDASSIKLLGNWTRNPHQAHNLDCVLWD